MVEPMNWIDAAAVFQTTVAIGMTAFVAWRYLLSMVKVPMLLISSSYTLMTLYTARGISIWGRPDSPWFWVAMTAYFLGDVGLFLFIVFGPPPPSSEGES